LVINIYKETPIQGLFFVSPYTRFGKKSSSNKKTLVRASIKIVLREAVSTYYTSLGWGLSGFFPCTPVNGFAFLGFCFLPFYVPISLLFLCLLLFTPVYGLTTFYGLIWGLSVLLGLSTHLLTKICMHWLIDILNCLD